MLLTAIGCGTPAPPGPPSAGPAVSATIPPEPVAAAAPPATAEVCTRTFPNDADLRTAKEGTPITIPEYFRSVPAAGRFTLEGFVQAPSHCAPCPPGATCKPCEDSIHLSEARGAYKHPIADGVDFRVVVPDATRFELLGRYRVTVEVCRRNGTSPELAARELRGYRRIADR